MTSTEYLWHYYNILVLNGKYLNICVFCIAYSLAYWFCNGTIWLSSRFLFRSLVWRSFEEGNAQQWTFDWYDDDDYKIYKSFFQQAGLSLQTDLFQATFINKRKGYTVDNFHMGIWKKISSRYPRLLSVYLYNVASQQTNCRPNECGLRWQRRLGQWNTLQQARFITELFGHTMSLLTSRVLVYFAKDIADAFHHCDGLISILNPLLYWTREVYKTLNNPAFTFFAPAWPQNRGI